MTKGSGWSVFMADSTKEMLIEEVDDLVHVDDFEVRGREAKITVWTIQAASTD